MTSNRSFYMLLRCAPFTAVILVIILLVQFVVSFGFYSLTGNAVSQLLVQTRPSIKLVALICVCLVGMLLLPKLVVLLSLSWNSHYLVYLKLRMFEALARSQRLDPSLRQRALRVADGVNAWELRQYLPTMGELGIYSFSRFSGFSDGI